MARSSRGGGHAAHTDGGHQLSMRERAMRDLANGNRSETGLGGVVAPGAPSNALASGEYLTHLLSKIDALRERHTGNGRAIVRLRQMLVEVEDGYLAHEEDLEELREGVKNTIMGNVTGKPVEPVKKGVAKISRQVHTERLASQNRTRRSVDSESVSGGSVAAGPGDAIELGDNSSDNEDESSDPAVDSHSPGVREPSPVRSPTNKSATNPQNENINHPQGMIKPTAGAAPSWKKPSSPRTAGPTWEEYTSAQNAVAPAATSTAQAEPMKRKQTARRSRPITTSKAGFVRKSHAEVAKERAKRNGSTSSPFAAMGIDNEQPTVQSFDSAQDAINSLPPPPKITLPIQPRTFSNALLAISLGGNKQTFAKVSENMLGKQVFRCVEMIKVNPEIHAQAPTTGMHGALVLVDGQEGSGEEGKVYPLFCRTSKNEWEYCGEYKVAKRVEIPVHVWQGWTDATKQQIARKVDQSNWGQKLLLDKGLAADEDELHDMSVKDILGFFEKTSTPNLRMCWTLLQCTGYDRTKHDNLAARQDEDPFNQLQSRGTSMSIERSSSVVALSAPPVHTPTSAITGKGKRKSRVVLEDTATPERATPTGTTNMRNMRSSATVLASNSPNSSEPEPELSPAIIAHKRRKLALSSDSSSSEPEKSTPAAKHTKKNPALRTPKTVPIEELSDSQIQYSSRGRRTRKDVDYRIIKEEIDGPIFRDDSDTVVKGKKAGKEEGEEERFVRYEEELKGLKGRAFKKSRGKGQ